MHADSSAAADMPVRDAESDENPISNASSNKFQSNLLLCDRSSFLRLVSSLKKGYIESVRQTKRLGKNLIFIQGILFPFSFPGNEIKISGERR